MSTFTRGEMPRQDLDDSARWIAECEEAGLDYTHGRAEDFFLPEEEFKRLRRGAHDLALYRTPDWAAEAVVRRLDCVRLGQTDTLSVLDAGAGDGAFCRALLKCGFDASQITAIEFCKRHEHALLTLAAQVWIGDFREWWESRRPRFDVIVMNPPFARSAEFFLTAWSVLRPHGQIAMLNRIDYASSAVRAELHRRYPPSVGVFSNRPSFVAGGTTDSWNYAAFYWTKNGRTTPGEFFVIPDGNYDAD